MLAACASGVSCLTQLCWQSRLTGGSFYQAFEEDSVLLDSRSEGKNQTVKLNQR